MGTGENRSAVSVRGSLPLRGAAVPPDGHAMNILMVHIFFKLLKISNTVWGAGEMAQNFRALVAPAEA